LRVGDLIDGLRPNLCVVAGLTGRRGVQRIAGTLVVNPGRLAEDSAAWLDRDRRSDDEVEFLED
jgi:Icc-related predicted phosphoesterase